MLKDVAKQHGPTVAISGVAVSIALALSGHGETVVNLPAAPTPHPSSLSERHNERNAQELRLVSCGDSRAASVTGTDESGSVKLGAGAGGRCTVLFARPWATPPTCTASGGHVSKITTTDLVVDQIDGAIFAFRCAP